MTVEDYIDSELRYYLPGTDMSIDIDKDTEIVTVTIGDDTVKGSIDDLRSIKMNLLYNKLKYEVIRAINNHEYDYPSIIDGYAYIVSDRYSNNWRPNSILTLRYLIDNEYRVHDIDPLGIIKRGGLGLGHLVINNAPNDASLITIKNKYNLTKEVKRVLRDIGLLKYGPDNNSYQLFINNEEWTDWYYGE